MIESIKTYIESNNCYGVLLSKLNVFCTTISDHNSDPTYLASGFTGSNATVLITRDRNILFTDTRYAQRAEQETNFDVSYESAYTWIKNNLNSDQKIVIDPMRHSYDSIFQIDNQILCDMLLYNKLEIPDETIAEDIFVVPSEDRKEALLDLLIMENADTVFLSPENFSWYSNMRNKLATYNKTILRFGIFMRDQIFSYDIFEIGKLLHDLCYLDINTILINTANTPYIVMKTLLDNKVCVKNKSIAYIQAKRTMDEILQIEQSNISEGHVFTNIIDWLKKQIADGKKITEQDVCNKILEIKSRNANFLGESFETICASGENSAIIHYSSKSSPRLIQPCDIVLIDSGSHYRYGTTDITRTITLGKPTDKQKKVYTLVLKGLLAVATTKFPITATSAQIDAIARQFLWHSTLNYSHSTGHGIGFVMNVHEAGYGISNSASNFEENMVMSCEPGCYLRGEFGVRLENTIVTKTVNDQFLQFKTLSRIPFDNELINYSMLSSDEVDTIKTLSQPAT